MPLDDIPRMPGDEVDPQEQFYDDTRELVWEIAAGLGVRANIEAALTDLYYLSGGVPAKLTADMIAAAIRRFPIE